MRGKGESSVFKDGRGLWTAAVELPPDPSGKRRRKTIRSKDKKTVLLKLAELKKELANRGDLPTADQTLEQWITYWLREVAPRDLRPKTLLGYRAVLTNQVIPVIGGVRLGKLSADHMRRVADAMTDKGLSATYALNAHRVLGSCLEDAVRENRIGRNPTKLLKAPRKSTQAQEAFEVDEAIAVLEHVSTDPVMGARWATGILTGARRGEVIGLERDRVTDILDLSWQLQRLTVTDRPGHPDAPADFEYRHIKGGLYWTRPKSSAGWRIIPLVEPLKSILERHIASTPPNEYGLVFVTESGLPIDPDKDTKRWNAVLAETGIERQVVLHGLRHTAADLLYLAGVSEDLIMAILGQSTRATTRGYKSQGKVNRMRLDDAMSKMSALLTPQAGARSETSAADAATPRALEQAGGNPVPTA
jgi:integrase